MADMLSSLSSLWKQQSLRVRTGYGWLKRRFVPHYIWDKEYFKRLYQWLQETQWWSKDQLEEYQLEQLQALVKHAYENVPYYRHAFDERRLKPQDITSLDDLRKLPLLTKEDVRNNSEDLLSRGVDREGLRLYTTGGSTGVPLSVYHDRHTTVLRESAFILRQWNWAGYRLGDRFATLRGDLITRSDRSGARAWWDYNTDGNELVFSSGDMSEESMHQYVELLREFNPRFIYAYPSSLEILARFMKRHGVNDIGVEAIFCSSETVYGMQRELIESQFGCKILDYYGLTEYVAGAAECEQHEGYHVNMEYGILELINKDGEPVAEAGTLGRVVGTGFGNYSMPLLRYSTDDLAVYSSGRCSCKRESTLIQGFRGRVREMVVSNTGRLVPFLAIYDGHTPVWTKIRELQFLQEREGELVVRIARAPSFSESEIARELLEELYERLDEEEFSVKVIFVDRVPRTQRGKLGFLEQKLPIEFKDLDQVGGEVSETAMGR